MDDRTVDFMGKFVQQAGHRFIGKIETALGVGHRTPGSQFLIYRKGPADLFRSVNHNS